MMRIGVIIGSPTHPQHWNLLSLPHQNQPLNQLPMHPHHMNNFMSIRMYHLIVFQNPTPVVVVVDPLVLLRKRELTLLTYLYRRKEQIGKLQSLTLKSKSWQTLQQIMF